MIRLATLVLLLSAAVPVTACAVECNGPPDMGPYVSLDARPWRAAHKQPFTACLDTNCIPVSAQQYGGIIQAGPFTEHPEKPMTLHVTGKGLDARLVVRLVQVRHDGPCGAYTDWSRQVDLDAQGHLSSA